MPEYIDIVDENNKVVGTEERERVHRDNLTHRSVHIFVFNTKGELFLQKRSVNKNEHPGKYDSSAAGHLDAGEGYDDAAIRELYEELSISAPLKKVMQVDACYETGNEFVYFYTTESDNEININEDEIDEGRFHSLKEIKIMLKNDGGAFTPAFLLIFNLYLTFTDL
jgi:16S rRNA (adenine1518-N6/adenine1519-N6)-dimethyltransferase